MAELAAANDGHVPSYGEDRWTRDVIARFRVALDDPDALVLPCFSGTGANMLATGLSGTRRLVVAEQSHIALDEEGGPLQLTGAVQTTLPAPLAACAPTTYTPLGGWPGAGLRDRGDRGRHDVRPGPAPGDLRDRPRQLARRCSSTARDCRMPWWPTDPAWRSFGRPASTTSSRVAPRRDSSAPRPCCHVEESRHGGGAAVSCRRRPASSLRSGPPSCPSVGCPLLRWPTFGRASWPTC